MTLEWEGGELSMTLVVRGFRAPDAHWHTMKKIWDACVAGNVKVPQEVVDYFNGESPDPRGVAVALTLLPWNEDGEGYEIAMATLPPGLTYIRFYVR